MFSWYRRSALTIVYLADVSGDGILSTSDWFKRGWTLQELPASRKVLFYTQDWSLYKGLSSSNHKEDGVVLNELEDTTGIGPRYLNDFKPGLDSARLRLQWASERRTTQPEDVAYSLFGIFGISLPIIPGESAENALGRLLTEIISKSGDVSVLDWVGEASSFHSCFPARIASYQSIYPTHHLLPVAMSCQFLASMHLWQHESNCWIRFRRWTPRISLATDFGYHASHIGLQRSSCSCSIPALLNTCMKSRQKALTPLR
ncbi:hypothetical protein SCLCIDRAFT_1168129 [Scleroderma citrinum Foug A]|uniref:Heterokaryon incompatibility domain-containing protein n=1 Tax=Scleroderma citrinum Foug A TaxID=1036808 RepID=A0A0C2ZRY6_9AGAM|nr:hypothetical protein SCLCIDRAFT_1168129 [Scleroderma citrinum Foug A]